SATAGEGGGAGGLGRMHKVPLWQRSFGVPNLRQLNLSGRHMDTVGAEGPRRERLDAVSEDHPKDGGLEGEDTKKQNYVERKPLPAASLAQAMAPDRDRSQPVALRFDRGAAEDTEPGQAPQYHEVGTAGVGAGATLGTTPAARATIVAHSGGARKGGSPLVQS